MTGKIGEEYFRDMVDRGRRELGGLLYSDSNIAQPMYPLRGQYGLAKEADSPRPEKDDPSFDGLHPIGASRDDRERDDRDRGMDRE